MSAELHLAFTSGNAEHFMNAGMVVYIVVNAIPPASLRGRISELGGKLTLRSSSEGVEIWADWPL